MEFIQEYTSDASDVESTDTTLSRPECVVVPGTASQGNAERESANSNDEEIQSRLSETSSRKTTTAAPAARQNAVAKDGPEVHVIEEIVKEYGDAGLFDVTEVWAPKTLSNKFLIHAKSHAEALNVARSRMAQNGAWQVADACLHKQGDTWTSYEVGNTLLRGKQQEPYLVIQIRHYKQRNNRSRPAAVIARFSDLKRSERNIDETDVDVATLEIPRMGDSEKGFFDLPENQEFLNQLLDALAKRPIKMKKEPTVVSNTAMQTRQRKLSPRAALSKVRPKSTNIKAVRIKRAEQDEEQCEFEDDANDKVTDSEEDDEEEWPQRVETPKKRKEKMKARRRVARGRNTSDSEMPSKRAKKDDRPTFSDASNEIFGGCLGEGTDMVPDTFRRVTSRPQLSSKSPSVPYMYFPTVMDPVNATVGPRASSAEISRTAEIDAMLLHEIEAEREHQQHSARMQQLWRLRQLYATK